MSVGFLPACPRAGAADRGLMHTFVVCFAGTAIAMVND
jgi:hypothetical protein